MERNIIKNIRFTDKEVKEIDKYADEIGLDFSNFVRMASKEKIAKMKKTK